MANYKALETLRIMFPQTKQEVLLHALENSDTMDAAVDSVLALQVPQDNEPRQRIVQREDGPRDVDDAFLYNEFFRQLPFQEEANIIVQAIREIFPDCDSDYILEKLDSLGRQDAVVVAILETRGTYPKRGTLKRKRTGPEEERKKKKDYSAKEATPMDSLYQKQCHAMLMNEFPRIPTNVIERIQQQNNHQYAPSYISLINTSRIAREIPEQSSFSLLKTPRKVTKPNVGHERLKEEEEWVNGWLDEQHKLPQGPPVTDPDMECSCCYNDVPRSQMTTCQDGHLFCFDCAKRHVAVIIGLRKTIIPCMSTEGCGSDFSPSEVRRFLDEKTLMGWEKLNQEIALKAADIDGFEECPFCSFGIIMPTTKEQDKLFHCKNDDCGRISCRLCQKGNHLPSSCEEAADDNVLGAQHRVEEAMTNALLRSCANCQQKFYKTEGCNKMVCPACRAITCYVCQQHITKQNYGHFNDNRKPFVAGNGKCILFDDTEARNANDVNAARERVMKELQQNASEVIDKIRVDTVVPSVVNQNPINGGVPNREAPPPFDFPPL
jgi:TRIAD3 protein (E3 ubiquitin-protein ligase RNF216)